MTITILNTVITVTASEAANPSKNTQFQKKASDFINIMKNEDVDGELEIGVEEILDDDGDVIGWTADKFHELDIVEKLDLCAKRYADDIGGRVTWVVAG